MTDHPDTDLTDPHGETEALRKENARLRAERDYDRSQSAHKSTVIDRLNARAEAAEAALAEATDPDFIWGAMDNVHDAETTLDDYAAAVSRAQRAALAASQSHDPVVNAGSCQPGDLISRAAAIEVAASIADRQRPDNMPHDAYMAYHSGAMDVLDTIRAIPAAPVAEAQQVVFGVDLASGPDQTVEWRWETTLEHIARDMRDGRFPARSERQCIVATSPVQPTIGGAELDALVKRLRAMSNHPESAYAEAAAAITALRSRPVGVTDKMINAAFDALPSDACGTIATGEMERVLEAALAAGRGRYDVAREWAQIKLSLDDGVAPASGCGDRLGIALMMIANGVANPAQVAREAMSAITALRAKAEVKVKPLVWRMEYGYTGRAETSIGVYLIERFPGQGQPYRLINAFDGKSSHSTLEAAKAAAQADYDARIRAALEGGE